MQASDVALLSLHPRHARKILSGEKRLEFRRAWANRPVSAIVIYATVPVQRIVAVAYVKEVHRGSATALWNLAKEKGGGLSRRELYAYFKGKQRGVAIEMASVLASPTPLDPQLVMKNFRPPQSFTYLDMATFARIETAIREQPVSGKVLFIGGVHGVGKTTLCEKYSGVHGALHKSASQLIREAKAAAISPNTKAVKDVAGNQQLLIDAVRQIRSTGRPLLLDGHFALLNAAHKVEPPPAKVFADLSIDGIVLVYDDHVAVASRIAKRDENCLSAADVEALQTKELSQSIAVARELGIPMWRVRSADVAEFQDAVSTFFTPQTGGTARKRCFRERIERVKNMANAESA